MYYVVMEHGYIIHVGFWK